MKLYAIKNYSDDEGPMAEEFKTAYLNGSRKDILSVCKFFEKVKEELDMKENEKSFHLHFRDYFENWQKGIDIDISINSNSE